MDALFFRRKLFGKRGIYCRRNTSIFFLNFNLSDLICSNFTAENAEILSAKSQESA